METLGSQRKMSTTVQCLFEDQQPPTGTVAGEEAETIAVATALFTVATFCHAACVSDYKFDKGQTASE